MLAVGVCEAAVRVYQYRAYGLPFFGALPSSKTAAGDTRTSAQALNMPNILDDRLGWRPAPGYRVRGQARRSDGSTYPLHVTQHAEGFRAFGDRRSHRPRLLVLGDSYTQALAVSDNKTYYARLGQSLGYEVFAIGADGFGSLQEYVLLDAYMERLRPQLVLWQFCYNDFMNNSYPLELAWGPASSERPRPYWEQGRVVFRLPKRHALLRRAALTSRLLYAMASLRDRWSRSRGAAQAGPDALTRSIIASGGAHPGFQAAAQTTDDILGMAARRAAPTPIVLFEACTTADPFFTTIQQIARRRGIGFIETLPGELNQAQQQGRALLTEDGVHWNEEAHVVIAESIARHLRDCGLVPPPPTLAGGPVSCVDFTQGDFTSNLGAGWHGREVSQGSGWRWMGAEASLWLGTGAGRRLVIRGHATPQHLPGGHVLLHVAVGQTPLGEIAATRPGPFAFAVDLPDRLLQPAALRVDLRADATFVPMAQGVGSDRRTLSVAINAVCLQ